MVQLVFWGQNKAFACWIWYYWTAYRCVLAEDSLTLCLKESCRNFSSCPSVQVGQVWRMDPNYHRAISTKLLIQMLEDKSVFLNLSFTSLCEGEDERKPCSFPSDCSPLSMMSLRANDSMRWYLSASKLHLQTLCACQTTWSCSITFSPPLSAAVRGRETEMLPSAVCFDVNVACLLQNNLFITVSICKQQPEVWTDMTFFLFTWMIRHKWISIT